MKKISVIIPVYNGEKYISRCIDSVLTQKDFNVNDIEILLINDGSKDNSLKILKKYESNYPKIIKVLTHKNMGVAKTRNKGIAIATGKYIIFIDQDDWIDKEYCKIFYDVINESSYDVASGGYTRPDSRGVVKKFYSPNINAVYSKYIIMAAWAKIHRTSFLRDNNIEFFDNKIGEDNVFTIKEIGKTHKWKLINYNGYNWYYNEESVSNTAQKKLNVKEIEALDVLLRELCSITTDKHDKLFNYYIIRTCVYYLLFSGRDATPKDFMTAYLALKSYIKSSLEVGGFISFGPKGEVFSVRLTVLVFIFLHKLKLVKLFARFYCRKR